MLRGIRSRLTYANVMATVAVFIALGGASYAAVKLPKNSVGSTQIKKNAVTGSKVRNSSLTGSDVKNGSLTAADFTGLLQGPQGASGAKGDAGPKGETGPVGPTQAVVAHASHNPLVNPVANPDTPLDPEYGETTFTTTKAGRLLLITTMPGAITCSPSGIGYAGMYLDGVPIPGTNQRMSTAVQAMTFSAVTDGVIPTGSHKVTIAYDCPNGAPGSWSYDTSHTTAVVVGG